MGKIYGLAAWPRFSWETREASLEPSRPPRELRLTTPHLRLCYHLRRKSSTWKLHPRHAMRLFNYALRCTASPQLDAQVFDERLADLLVEGVCFGVGQCPLQAAVHYAICHALAARLGMRKLV